MDESDFEEIVKLALTMYARENDLPMQLVTVKDKGFGDEAGLLVTLGENEFHLAITQTVFEEEA